MFFIFNLSLLLKLFPEEKFDVLFCDNDFNIIETSSNFLNFKFNLDKPIDTYFFNCNEFIDSINSNSPPAFSNIQLKFENYLFNALFFTADSNTKNIKYYIIIEKNQMKQQINSQPLSPECIVADLVASHSISAFNCTYSMVILIEELEKQGCDVNHLKEHVNEISKFCFSNIKTYRSIEIYSDLVNQAITFNMKVTDLNQFIRSCIQHINSLATPQGRKEDTVYEAKARPTANSCLKISSHSKDIYVKVDTDLLQIAIVEIVSNAYKFSLDTPNVTIIIRNDDEKVYISCTDEGVGFDNDSLIDPFEPFAKHHKFVLTNDLIGLGLGLTISKRIVRNFNGDITYSNNTNKDGANVTISLPIVKDYESNSVLCSFDNLINDKNSFSHSKVSFSNIFGWKY